MPGTDDPTATLVELLAQVIETGQPLTWDQVKTVRCRRSDNRTIDAARRRLLVTSRKLVGMRDDDRPQAARALARDTVEQYRQFTDAKLTPPWDPAKLPPRGVGIGRTHKQPAEAGHLGALRALFTTAATGKAITAAQIEALPVRRNFRGEDLTVWREHVATTCRVLADQPEGKAALQELIDTEVRELSYPMATIEEQRQPVSRYDHLSPSELADLIPREQMGM